MIKINRLYDYKSLQREDRSTGRCYVADGQRLPSVTTILSKTKPLEEIKSLNEWKQRVGKDEAERVTKEASNVGTIMHNILEHWVLNEEYDPGDNIIHRQAKRMAETVKENIKDNINEIWGSEVNLYYPDLYAGTTDLVGMWNGKPAIMDFKQTNKPKKREWISNYFLQLCAYAEAHDILFDTNIDQGVIFMCSREGEFQQFEIVGEEFDYWKEQWANRITKYYNIDGN